MLSSTQVLGSILMQTLGICWGLPTSSFLITSRHYDGPRIGIPLRLAENWGVRLPHHWAWDVFLGAGLLLSSWGLALGVSSRC